MTNILQIPLKPWQGRLEDGTIYDKQAAEELRSRCTYLTKERIDEILGEDGGVE